MTANSNIRKRKDASVCRHQYWDLGFCIDCGIHANHLNDVAQSRHCRESPITRDAKHSNTATDRLVVRLLRIMARLIGGADAVKQFDAERERLRSMPSEAVEAELTSTMEQFLKERKKVRR
jgi:hypothetical protein